MSATVDAVSEFIQREFAQEHAFLAEIVKVPSDNPPGDCRSSAQRAQQLLEQLGFEVESHQVPEDLVRANGMISATNLIVRETFGSGGPVIALNAHGDVVPPGRGWKHDPYGAEVVDDPAQGSVMFGRGVAVSKSDFATYTWTLLALRELKKRGTKLNGTVELHFTYDEEVGGEIGPGWIIEQNLSRPDLVICAGFSYSVTTAHNGCLHLEVVVNGKSGHAAIPETGVDALEAASAVLNAIYAYRQELKQRRSMISGIGTATINVGLIQGGINTNVVPDRVTLRIDRRIIPEEKTEDAETELRTLIQRAVADRAGITVEISRILLAMPLVQLPGATKMIEILRRNGEAVFGVPIGASGVPLYTDARHYSQAGIPTVLYGAGPRTLQEANGHMADENLRLVDLKRATIVVAATLAELLGD
ncbi:MAG: M20/M25/M40 family metallo-hydrolase [Povalibacter sp.]